MKFILFILLTFPIYAEYKTYEVSFFCSCSKCCHPYSGKRTASGTVPTRFRTAASNTLPFQTKVHIPGFGWRTIEDRMSSAYGHRLDIYTDSHSRAKKLGIRKIKVWIER